MTTEPLNTRLAWTSQAYVDMCGDVLTWIHSDDELRASSFLHVLGKIDRAKCELDALARRIKDEPLKSGAAHG